MSSYQYSNCLVFVLFLKNFYCNLCISKQVGSYYSYQFVSSLCFLLAAAAAVQMSISRDGSKHPGSRITSSVKGRTEKICTCNKYSTYSNISHEHFHKLMKESQKANMTDTAISGMGKKYVQGGEKWEQKNPEWSRRSRNKNYHFVMLFKTTA